MSCQDVEKDLIPYAEGDLDDIRSEVVRAHVEACARCQAEVRAIRRTLGMAAAYRIPPLSKAAEVRMLAGVRAQVGRHRGLRRAYRLAPALSAVAAVLTLAVVGLRYRTPDVAPVVERAVEGGAVGADRIALLANDPELFDAVMERLSGLDVGGVQGTQKEDLRSSTGRGERPREGEPLWREYQKGYFPGVRVEALLKDLSDEEMDQVLQNIEERLTV